MNAYIDTGVFFDYLLNRSPSGGMLRRHDRRGRTPKQLNVDATKCLDLARKNRHKLLTSALTLFELEKTVHAELAKSAKGIRDKNSYVVPSARTIIVQSLVTIQTYDIELVDLSLDIVKDMVGKTDLQTRGILFADSAHVVTALRKNADLIVSTDDDILGLDGVFTNTTGVVMRCVDTDNAITLL